MTGMGVPARPTGLVGRDEELGAALAALSSVAPASGHALLIRGEPGIGKSRLLDAVVQTAAERFRIVSETASALEQELPFAPLMRALRLRPDAGDPGAAAVGALLSDSDVADPHLRRLQVIEAIADLVERWALAQPVLIAIDDLQWADSATLQTLDRLARRLHHLGVLLVGAARPHPVPAALGVLEHRLVTGGGTVIELSPFGNDDVVELARQLLGTAPGPHLTAALRNAGGNPLYITELLAAAQTESTDDGPADLPASGVPEPVRLTILRNLSSLPRGTVELLRTASVLGTRFDVRQLAITADRPEVDVVDELLPAFASRVLSEAGERVAFRHDLVRDAIYEDQPAAVRAAAHRRVVEALRAAETPVEDLIPHLLRGSWRGVPEAGSWLAEAGRAMRERSLPLAVDLLERALEHADSRATTDLRLDLAEILAVAGHAEELATVLEPILAEPVTALSERARDRLVQFASPFGAPIRPVEEQRAFLDALEQAGLSTAGRNQAMGLRAWLHWLGGRRDDATALATEALAMATSAGDHVTACLLELVVSRTREVEGLGGNPAAHARAALEHARLVRSRPELFLVAAGTLALHLGNESDRRPEAKRVVSEALAVADRTGLERQQMVIEAITAVNEQRAGDWEDAAVRFETALAGLADDAVLVAGPAGAALFHARAARLALHRGELDRAREHVDVAHQLRSSMQRAGDEHDELVHVYLAESELQLASGDHDAAITAIHRSAAFVESRDIGIFFVSQLPDVTGIAWRAGRPDEAAAAVERAERWLHDHPVPDPDSHALLRWGRARLDADPEALEGLVAWADGPRPLWEWRPRVREDAAAVLADEGHRDRAVRWLEEALALWDGVGARRDVDRVRETLRGLGIRRGRGLAADRPDTGWASLTDMEWRVVRLVGQGLIYREIGERLFISRRTVETHVQHVFRKLGVSSRRDLTLLLHSDEAKEHRAGSPAP